MEFNNKNSCIYVGNSCQTSDPCSHSAYARYLPGTNIIDRTKFDTNQFYIEECESIHNFWTKLKKNGFVNINGRGENLYKTFLEVGEPVPNHFNYKDYWEEKERERRAELAEMKLRIKYEEWLSNNKEMLDGMFDLYNKNFIREKRISSDILSVFNKYIYDLHQKFSHENIF